MITAVSNPFETPGALTDSAKKTIGAIVVGGDYQGLGIVRSLGRKKVPVCVIDDERSIACFSKYTTHAVNVPSLRDEKETVDHLLEIFKKNSVPISETATNIANTFWMETPHENKGP